MNLLRPFRHLVGVWQGSDRPGRQSAGFNIGIAAFNLLIFAFRISHSAWAWVSLVAGVALLVVAYITLKTGAIRNETRESIKQLKSLGLPTKNEMKRKGFPTP